MTAPDPQPRWTALRVGPGGIPPEHVRPVPATAVAPDQSAAQRVWPSSPSQPPAAVLGSFDDDGPHRPSRRAVWGWVALAVVAITVVATALWSSATPQAADVAVPAIGECLSAGGTGSVVAVNCDSDAADLRVVARYDGAGDRSSCDAVRPDVVMVAGERSVLCLDYVARVGECLFAGEGRGTGSDAVGKRPCADAYAGTQDLYRVLAVLPGETDDASCPVGTLQSLVHRSPTEVVCLGFP